MEVKMTIEMEEVVRNFDRLQGKPRAKVINDAKKAAGRVVLKRAKGYAPVRSGALKRSLRVGTKDKGKVVVAAGKALRYKGKEEDAYYALMVERGHKTRGRRGSRGGGTGFVKGKFYLERAAEEMTQQALESFKESFSKGVDGILKKSRR